MKRSYLKSKTPLKRGTKMMKRSGFARKTTLTTQSGLKRTTAPRKRKHKSDLKRLKEQLWKLCREIQIKRYGSDCYTCRSKDLQGSNRHLGHFISSSICSTELRYDLDNLKIQCYSCNINKSGNWLSYERRLRREYGIDFVENLKDRNEATKGLMYRELWYEHEINKYQGILDSLTDV